MYKELHFGDDMKDGIVRGIEKTARAVGSTLGPSGRVVLISNPFGTSTMTKDGVSVAKAITLEDPLEEEGAKLVKNVAEKTNRIAGDGTTTTSILVGQLVSEGVKALDKQVNPIQLKNGMKRALNDAIADIKRLAKPIESKEDLYNVAFVSANRDDKLAEMISEAVSQVGNDGILTISKKNYGSDDVEYLEGMSWDRGLASKAFLCGNSYIDLEDPYFLLYPYKLIDFRDLIPLLEKFNNDEKHKARPLVVIADEFDPDALATMLFNHMNKTINCLAIQCPFGQQKMERMEDIAVLTGGTVISKDVGLDLSKVELGHLGHASSARLSEEKTEIIDGWGDEEALEERVEEIEKEMEKTTLSDYERDVLRDRKAKLCGGVAVIHISATTDLEFKERYHRVEDALCSARSSLREGILAGGGSTMCQVAYKLSKHIPNNLTADEKVGYKILLKAMERPLRQIGENGGLSGDVLVEKCQKLKYGQGYNAYSNKWENLIESGVIDPAIVAIESLRNSTSVAELVLTSDCAIITKLNKEEEDSINSMLGKK